MRDNPLEFVTSGVPMRRALHMLRVRLWHGLAHAVVGVMCGVQASAADRVVKSLLALMNSWLVDLEVRLPNGEEL